MHKDITLVQVHYYETVVFCIVEELQTASISPFRCLNWTRDWCSVWLCGVIVVYRLDHWTLGFHLGDWAFGRGEGHYGHLDMLRIGHIGL